MASSPISRAAPVVRRPVDHRLIEAPVARKVEPVVRRNLRQARNRRDDQVEYSLAPPRPIEGSLRAEATSEASPGLLARARGRLWTFLRLIAPARGYGVRLPKAKPRRSVSGQGLPKGALRVLEVRVLDQTEEVTLLPVDPDGQGRGGRGGGDEERERRARLMEDEEDTAVGEPAAIFRAPHRARMRGAISIA